MGYDLCLCRYEKGIVKEYANYQEIADKVHESGGGYVASDRSLACLWFSKNLESIKLIISCIIVLLMGQMRI